MSNSTETMTLTSFLLARIAEDEAAADRVEFRPYVGEGVPESLTARMLAECEAKRRIVELHSEAEGRCETCHIYATGVLGNAECCPTLRALALPYADHPDYRESWRP